MNLKEEFTFLHNLGLNVTFFGKDLRKCHRGPGKSNIFIIVTRSDGDKLHYRDTIPEEDLNRPKNWIRCGDPTGLTAEWRDVHVGNSTWKAYLAGESQEIDCSGVRMKCLYDGGTTYTYARTGGAKWIKIAHPEDEIRPSNILSSFHKLEKLTSVQVSIPERAMVRLRTPFMMASPTKRKHFTKYLLTKLAKRRHQALWL